MQQIKEDGSNNNNNIWFLKYKMQLKVRQVRI